MQRIATDDGLLIGELAARAGLTVRTLHHYDQIGLVRASERTEAGHRCHSEADVRRLYQVVALRSLGVPLARIARALEGDGFTLKTRSPPSWRRSTPNSCTRGACDGAWSGSSRCWNAPRTHRSQSSRRSWRC
jgi:DNA-binding transcriptional MerR regulator